MDMRISLPAIPLTSLPHAHKPANRQLHNRRMRICDLNLFTDNLKYNYIRIRFLHVVFTEINVYPRFP